MDQDLFLKLALFFASIGVVCLLLILYFYEVKPVSVFEAKILEKDIPVKISGVIYSVSKTNASTKVVVSSLQKISVIVFDDVDILQNDEVIVEGKIDRFNGDVQIIADSIVKK